MKNKRFIIFGYGKDGNAAEKRIATTDSEDDSIFVATYALTGLGYTNYRIIDTQDTARIIIIPMDKNLWWPNKRELEVLKKEYKRVMRTA